MPNHTTNIMTLEGPRAELERFMLTVSSKNPELMQRRRKELEASIASATAALKKDPNDRMAQMNLNNSTASLKELDEDKYECALDFDGTFPMPIELEGTTSPMRDEKQAAINRKLYGASDWYEWKNHFWGTKWGAYDVEAVEDNGTSVVYRYQTAWSPALPWIENTSGIFPELTITISAKDEGDGFFLVNKYKAGECIEENDFEAHDWLMEFDAEYASVYANVFEVGYEEGIKFIVEQGSIDWRTEEKLLEFIKDDDLPLFINFQWDNDEVKELYSKRLKALDKEGVEKERREEKQMEKAKKAYD